MEEATGRQRIYLEGIFETQEATGRMEEATGRQRTCLEGIFETQEATGREVVSDRSPSSTSDDGNDASEATGRPECDDRSPGENLEFFESSLEGRSSDTSNSHTDEIDTRPSSALPLPQSTRDNEVLSSDVSNYSLPPRTTRGKPKVQYSPDIHVKSKYPINHYMSTHRLSKSYASYLCQLSSVCVPTKLQDALSDQNWVDAMHIEMEALNKNATWELVPLPKGKKAVGCRWVFTLKHKADGSIDRYKARLVAKGYTQTYGVDYTETFAPVAKLNTVRVLLSLAANRDWPLLQFDIKNAFLHGDLKEEIYMDPPPGIPVTSKEGVVCKLRKSLYGLKQSPRAWFGRFAASMKKFGYVQSNSDHTLFLKRHKGKLTALIIYVDDMIVTEDDHVEIQSLQKYLASEFEMKSLGDLKYFLGIEVARFKHGIFLSQRKYVLDLLAETGMLDCKPIDTPSEQNHKLGIYPDQVPTDKERYQRLVGKLIYLAHTRPDIAYAVNIVSQFMHSPSVDNMGAVTRILRYLKVTPGKGLIFSKYGHTNVEGYTDADWAGSATDRRSTSGILCLWVAILLRGGARNKRWCLDLVLRLSIGEWPMVYLSYYG
ncbi:hypothetical protein CerSpe_229560 [Prunus speciosa]